MHSDDITTFLADMLNFLIEELRETRKNAIPPGQMHLLLLQSERRTQRLRRIADAMTRLDEQTALPPQ